MKAPRTLPFSFLHRCLLLLAGSAVLAFGLCHIHAVSKITEGGVLGLTLLLQHWMHLSPALTGLILNKMDGTAKGGIVLSIRKELNSPVKFIGVGERIDDMQEFDQHEFVAALFE
jgi:hypothetical protein